MSVNLKPPLLPGPSFSPPLTACLQVLLIGHGDFYSFAAVCVCVCVHPPCMLALPWLRVLNGSCMMRSPSHHVCIFFYIHRHTDTHTRIRAFDMFSPQSAPLTFMKRGQQPIMHQREDRKHLNNLLSPKEHSLSVCQGELMLDLRPWDCVKIVPLNSQSSQDWVLWGRK